MNTFRRAALLVAVALLVGTWGSLARAVPRDTIQVFPGPHALADALAAASPGDTLNIHPGTYPERVTVSKANLTLKASSTTRPVIDGQCGGLYTMRVFASGVTTTGLKIQGAGYAELSYENVPGGTVTNDVLRDTCSAEYGINLFDAGSVLVQDNRSSGFGDAALYIGGINSTPNALLRALDNVLFNSARGIIVEDSFTQGVVIRLRGNDIHNNGKPGKAPIGGIYITNSDRVVIRANMVKDNGPMGIELNQYSDLNRVIGNTVTGHTFDLKNEAGNSGNCFSSNTYNTSQGNVSTPC